MCRPLNALLLLIFVISSCSPSIQYMGRSYPPTSNVDIYFNAADVKKSYEVMGKVDGKAWPLSDYSKIQESIVAEAKKKGADGVIITGMKENVIGTSKNTTTTTTGNSSTSTSGTPDNGKSTQSGWDASITTNTTSSQQTEKVVSADFIKYKQ